MSSPGLKRPLEFDQHLNPNLAGLKRRTGNFFIQHQTDQPQHQMYQPHSSHHQQQQPHYNLTSSPFKGNILAPLSDEVAKVIKDEVIRHRNQQHQNQHLVSHPNPITNIGGSNNSSSSLNTGNINNSSSSSGTSSSHSSHNNHEPPVLTIRQTQIICEKLIKEREQKLREEYDRILMSKLSEQYETFVKYAHDHLEKNPSTHQASYIS